MAENFSLTLQGNRTEVCLRPFTDRRPLVLHIITGLGRGGAEKSLADLVTRSQSFRHEVVSLTDGGYWAPLLRQAGIPVHVLGISSGAALPRALMRLWAILRRSSPVLVQTWLYHADLLGTVAASLVGVPVVWSLRCSDMDLARYRWVTRLLAGLSRLPSLVVANSEAGRRWHAKLGYRARRWEVIPNGVDTELYRPDGNRRATWRARLGVGDDTILVGMCARRDPMKDHETFISAAHLLVQRQDGIVFCIAGRGTDDDRGLRALSDGIAMRWVGECADTPGLLAALDIFVLPSRFGEGFANVVAEAMACGLACVVTEVGDCACLVGETGVVVPPADAGAIAAAIARLAIDRSARCRRGAEARMRVEQEFPLPRMVSRYEAAWRSVIGGSQCL